MDAPWGFLDTLESMASTTAENALSLTVTLEQECSMLKSSTKARFVLPFVSMVEFEGPVFAAVAKPATRWFTLR
jgi:hypothetical protein